MKWAVAILIQLVNKMHLCPAFYILTDLYNLYIEVLMIYLKSSHCT